MKGSEQYSENMVTIMSTTYCSLVSSVAVTSMKTFLVSSEIFVPSELICAIGKARSEAGSNEQPTSTYNGWHRQHLSGRVIDDGVHRGSFNDVQISREMLVLLRAEKVSDRCNRIANTVCANLVQDHEFLCSVLFVFVQRYEADVSRGEGLLGLREISFEQTEAQ